MDTITREKELHFSSADLATKSLPDHRLDINFIIDN